MCCLLHLQTYGAQKITSSTIPTYFSAPLNRTRKYSRCAKAACLRSHQLVAVVAVVVAGFRTDRFVFIWIIHHGCREQSTIYYTYTSTSLSAVCDEPSIQGKFCGASTVRQAIHHVDHPPPPLRRTSRAAALLLRAHIFCLHTNITSTRTKNAR